MAARVSPRNLPRFLSAATFSRTSTITSRKRIFRLVRWRERSVLVHERGKRRVRLDLRLPAMLEHRQGSGIGGISVSPRLVGLASPSFAAKPLSLMTLPFSVNESTWKVRSPGAPLSPFLTTWVTNALVEAPLRTMTRLPAGRSAARAERLSASASSTAAERLSAPRPELACMKHSRPVT